MEIASSTSAVLDTTMMPLGLPGQLAWTAQCQTWAHWLLSWLSFKADVAAVLCGGNTAGGWAGMPATLQCSARFVTLLHLDATHHSLGRHTLL